MPEESHNKYKYIYNADSPEALKKIPEKQIPALCDEIREFLIENVSETGGHLASNLGVVELSVAIHRVFSTPKDHIIFDVGHQSYVHKILTGRRERFSELRALGGISGFEKRGESEHDCFGTGHSSTSLSAALGFAEGDRIKGDNDSYTVAVVGDGAFTGGMIHEALNNCSEDLRLVIILNENEMSISKNIGHFAKNLSQIRSTRGYGRTKRAMRLIVSKIPFVGKYIFNFLRNVKKHVKNTLYGSNYFEDMGLYYIGPVDGNDYSQVESALWNAREYGGSAVVHVKTKKGKGYKPAEDDPSGYHSMRAVRLQNEEKKITFSEAFGNKISEKARTDGRICAVTAAMCDGTGLNRFRTEHPERFFDVGIAEEHALTFAAGLSADGLKPVAAIYSTFIQRGYDNIVHDIALQGLPVIMCIDRAGLNACDGATHHGIFDVSFLSAIPNIEIYAPITYKSLETALDEALSSDKATAIRYPSGSEDESIVKAFFKDGFTSCISKWTRSTLPENSKPDVLIVTYGRIASEALKAVTELEKNGVKAGIVLLEKLKPYRLSAESVVPFLPKRNGKIVFLEEGIRAGGMGMLMCDELSEMGVLNDYTHAIAAINDDFVLTDKKGAVYELAEISSNDIVRLCK